jgi:hypothetical protein
LAGRLLEGLIALAFLCLAESGVVAVIEKSSLKTQVNFLTIPTEGECQLNDVRTNVKNHSNHIAREKKELVNCLRLLNSAITVFSERFSV